MEGEERTIRKYGLPLLALGMLCFAIFQVVRSQQVPPKLEPPVQPARSPVGNGVAGAGLVEAETENIAVGSPLSGVVTEVAVKVGQKVKAGELLFKVDDRALLAELRICRANLTLAKAQLVELEKMPRPGELPAPGGEGP